MDLVNDLILNLSTTNPFVHATQIIPKLLKIPNIPILAIEAQPSYISGDKNTLLGVLFQLNAELEINNSTAAIPNKIICKINKYVVE